MSNSLATLNGYLDTALNDASDMTWASAEKNNVIDWAVAMLWPRVSFPTDPTSTTLSLVAGTYFYELPADDGTIMAVSKLGLVADDDTELGFLTSSWEIVGDVYATASAPQIHISPVIVDSYAGGVVRVYGYCRFDTSAALIPDEYVPPVLATARAELYRRVTGDRTRFKAWLSRQQTQNVSENEALSMVADAQRDADRLRDQRKVWQRPVPGRV